MAPRSGILTSAVCGIILAAAIIPLDGAMHGKRSLLQPADTTTPATDTTTPAADTTTPPTDTTTPATDGTQGTPGGPGSTDSSMLSSNLPGPGSATDGTQPQSTTTGAGPIPSPPPPDVTASPPPPPPDSTASPPPPASADPTASSPPSPASSTGTASPPPPGNSGAASPPPPLAGSTAAAPSTSGPSSSGGSGSPSAAAGATVNLNVNTAPSDPVVLNNYYTPVTTAFKTNNVNVFVNTVVVIKTVVQVDAFVQATVSVCNSGTKHGVGTPFTKLYALAFAQAASKNINSAAFTIARIAVVGGLPADLLAEATVQAFLLGGDTQLQFARAWAVAMAAYGCDVVRPVLLRVQVIAVQIGNGGLFVVFITVIPALQICFTGDVARATAVAKSSVTSFGGSVTAIADAKAMASVGSRRHLLFGGI